ncbi:MAG: hypothetical protein ACRDKE_04325 [Solirubrobacterales bacterium]
MSDRSDQWRQVNARRACPTHHEVGLALAASFDGDAEVAIAAEQKLQAIARDLADARLPGDPAAELIETGRVLDEWLTCDSTETLRSDFGDLLMPHALVAGAGHELALTAAALAACADAGLPFGAVASSAHIYLAHQELSEPYILAPRFGWRFIEATDLREGQLKWLCPHELSGLALDRMNARAATLGRVDLQLRVSQLRVDLPMDQNSCHDAQNDLAMARARFN